MRSPLLGNEQEVTDAVYLCKSLKVNVYPLASRFKTTTYMLTTFSYDTTYDRFRHCYLRTKMNILNSYEPYFCLNLFDDIKLGLKCRKTITITGKQSQTLYKVEF